MHWHIQLARIGAAVTIILAVLVAILLAAGAPS